MLPEFQRSSNKLNNAELKIMRTIAKKTEEKRERRGEEREREEMFT